jgi:signal transduction histidine kinase
MAEVATNVLHNVGNVLTSVNVSANLASAIVRSSHTRELDKLNRLLTEHRADLATFIGTDPRGQQIPGFIDALTESVAEERSKLSAELAMLEKNIEHLNAIIAMQQGHAKAAGVRELISLEAVVEDALQLRHLQVDLASIQVQRQYGELPQIEGDRHKLLQIVTNLLSNAIRSLKDAATSDKRLVLRTRALENREVLLEVEDSGCGIAREHLPLIFTHGFTTKPDGHGFGLHYAACNAAELGGTLSAESEGLGRGATFRLVFPSLPGPSSAPAASAAVPRAPEAGSLALQGKVASS